MNTAVKTVNNKEAINMQYIDICAEHELIDNIGQCALVNGKQVAVFRLSDCERLFAIANYDPFSQANVISRGVVGDLGGQLVVASPVYKQHFDLSNGICLEDTEVVLDTYPVRINNSRIEIGTQAER